ncbi:dihydrofolate reductase [Ruminobacter sp.]
MIDADIEGDTTFPEYDTRDYKIIASEHFSADEKNACDMDFITYEKIKK